MIEFPKGSQNCYQWIESLKVPMVKNVLSSTAEDQIDRHNIKWLMDGSSVAKFSYVDDTGCYGKNEEFIGLVLKVKTVKNGQFVGTDDITVCTRKHWPISLFTTVYANNKSNSPPNGLHSHGYFADPGRLCALLTQGVLTVKYLDGYSFQLAGPIQQAEAVQQSCFETKAIVTTDVSASHLISKVKAKRAVSSVDQRCVQYWKDRLKNSDISKHQKKKSAKNLKVLRRIGRKGEVIPFKLQPAPAKNTIR